MALLEIEFSNGRIAALRLDGELYFIRLDVHIPEVYDRYCNKLTIPNINTWINNKTHQQYDFFHILDLCDAFRKGYMSSVMNRNPEQYVLSLIKRILRTLFTSGLAYRYVNDYWIECTDPTKLSAKIISPIMKKYDLLIKKLGKSTFEDYANRIRRISTAASSTSVDKMFERLRLEIRDPLYPDTDELDRQFAAIIMHDVTLTTVPDDILKRMKECENKFL